ncbi:hypothetical protein HNP99_002788 [Flavobacterium sp. 28A]|uniref:hypothetical protein n=1 Tax=Flavobacterium sp. 28A TaxID=2735895 RepID=UPI001C2DDEA4|nr:hypothetical protein [Flavobacterium sp. 28A]NRT16421.1 hypothetical protein [Flavobacterium sp. 28A]
MKKSTIFIKQRVKQIVICICITAMFSLSGYAQQAEIKFPLKVGVKPESITKGFNDNYYVTLMNGAEQGDGEIVEISKNGVKVFAKGFDDPKGIVFLKGHLYLSDLTRIWKVDSAGHVTVFVKKEDFPEVVLYLNDVAVDA